MAIALVLLVTDEKSELIPKQSMVFLWERLNSAIAKAFITSARAEAFADTIGQATKAGGMRFDQAESLLGRMTSAFPTIELGRMHLRTLQSAVISAGPKPLDSKARSNPSPFELVVESDSLATRSAVPSADATGITLHRRFAVGLGVRRGKDSGKGRVTTSMGSFSEQSSSRYSYCNIG